MIVSIPATRPSYPHPEHPWLIVVDQDCPAIPHRLPGEPTLPTAGVDAVAAYALRIRAAYRGHNLLVFRPTLIQKFCQSCVDRVLDVLDHPRDRGPDDHQLEMACIEEMEERLHRLRPWLALAELARAYGLTRPHVLRRAVMVGMFRAAA